MSEQNSSMCKLCQKVLAPDEASNLHGEAWCGDNEDNVTLQGKNPKE